MRRRIRWIAAALLCVGVSEVQAQVVTCANCGTEFTQLANNLQLVDQLAKQAQMVQQNIEQFANMQLNTTGLDGQEFGKPLEELKRISAVLAGAKSLSFNSTKLDADFRNKYRDYAAYLQEQPDPEGLSGKLKQWSEDTNSSVLTTLQGAGLQSSQIEGEEDALFRQLEGLAQTAEGRMQALQVGNQIALATARQAQKLRQLIAVHMALQANFIARQSDREATQDAALQRFTTTRREEVKSGDGKGF